MMVTGLSTVSCPSPPCTIWKSMEKCSCFTPVLQNSLAVGWSFHSNVAVATGQLTWPSVLGHVDNVLQLAEQEQMKGNRPFVSYKLCEELLQKNWARRAEKNDPSRNIQADAQKIDAADDVQAKSERQPGTYQTAHRPIDVQTCCQNTTALAKSGCVSLCKWANGKALPC